MTTSKESIARLAHIIAQKGITHAVISPGSRNAPLIIAMTDRVELTCLNIPDERVAGFYALGLAMRTQRPVVLCCTSGSAMLNYAPAIAEAYYQKIPLLILTADRPVEWIDQRAGQTMRQVDAFDNYIVKSYTLTQEASSKDELCYNDRIVNEAINYCRQIMPGPVHINVPLKEPLYEQVENTSEPKIISSMVRVSDISDRDQIALKSAFDKHEKILVVCGQHQPSDEWRGAIEKLSRDPKVVVLSEATSNLSGEHIISCIDRTIDGIGENFYEFTPSLLVTCGASIVSKKIRFLLRSMNIQEHWHVDDVDHHIDTYQSLTRNIPLTIARFVDIVLGGSLAEVDVCSFKRLWTNRNTVRKTAHADYIDTVEWSDLSVVAALMSHVPSRTTLHMANSTSVRYVQLFDSRPDVVYQCNRGVSGIDGCTSTAAGYAYVDDHLNVLLTGDIAFFYDSNAFWHHHLRPNLRVLILNNAGGSIFRVIPGPGSTDQLETHFEAHHNRSAEHLARTYELGYYKAQNESALDEGLKWLFADSHTSPAILEVFTPRFENDKILKRYFEVIQ